MVKEFEKNNDDIDQNIYASMERMFVNDKCSSRDFGDSSLLTNWILDSGETCHMTPQVSDFIPGLVEDTDTYIEVADGQYTMTKKKDKVEIRMCDDNGDTIIAILHNIVLALDLCSMLFMIIMIMNLGHTCLFYKDFSRSTLAIKRKCGESTT